MGEPKNRTSGGVEVTDDLVERLADEAERGYDLSTLRPRPRGRPRLGADVLTVLQVRVDAELRNALQRRADREGTTVSAIARQALADYVLADSGSEAVPVAAREHERGRHRPYRTVLAVVDSLVSTKRLLDVLTLIASDRRVQVIFSIDNASSGIGVVDLLMSLGTRVVPWNVARTGRYDLVVAAHLAAELAELDGPMMLLPHQVRSDWLEKCAERGRLLGRRTGELPPGDRHDDTAIGIIQKEQLGRVRKACPAVSNKVFVAGDPTFDRIVAHLSHREGYRRALNVGGRRMVVVSSTWGRGSLLGGHPELLTALLAQLPSDEYKVAALLHPEIWQQYGTWQIRVWFHDALAHGLLLIPPGDGWQAALIAADVVIGDHGSVSHYAADLGRPVLELVTEPDSEDIPTGSTQSMIMDPAGDLRAQVDSAVSSSSHDLAKEWRSLTRASGKTTRILYDKMYELLDLAPRKELPPAVPIPVPTPVA